MTRYFDKKAEKDVICYMKCSSLKQSSSDSSNPVFDLINPVLYWNTPVSCSSNPVSDLAIQLLIQAFQYLVQSMNSEYVSTLWLFTILWAK